MELDQYLGIFIDESKENLQKLNESLLKLEANSEDLEILNDIFRVAHTLKGMSRTMGFNNIADLTHNMENVLDPLRNGSLKATGKVIDTLFKCLDRLEGLTGKVIEGDYEDKNGTIVDLVDELQSILNDISDSSPSSAVIKEVTFNEYELALVNNALEKGFKPVEIDITLTSDCVLLGVRAYMVSRALESYGEIIKTVPDSESLENGEFEKSFKLFFITQESSEIIYSIIKEISEIQDVQIKPLQLQGIRKEANEIQQDSQKEESNEIESVAAIVNNVNNVVNAQPGVAKVVPQTIRVSAGRLDKLMNLVGELVINRTRIAQLSSEQKMTDLTSAISMMGTITSDIQEIVMKLRMVPIEQVFNRFPRLVRDISKELKKDINLKITGKDTEIDRVVIDEIGDPLVHLIRNSLDHGLESPEERISTGKTAKGTIELVAFNEGDNILIKVIDDGRGIDADNVKASAMRKGLITAEAAKNMTEKEAIELIFMPGFSTVQVATDISGRGVGMDVVKSKVAQLGGDVTITSKIKQGTSITISLPSTMAIVQALLLKVGQEVYAAPLNYISEVINIEPNQVKNVQNKEVIVLRGATLPLFRMHRLLQVPNYKQNPDESLTVVIVKSQGRSLGVIVSELIGQQEVVIKPINKKLCKEEFISGATTLGNGQVALIINVNALWKL